MRATLLLAALLACGKKAEDTGDLPPPITLTSAADATAVEASLSATDVDLVTAEHVLAMTVDMIVSDNTVKTTFYNNGDLGTTSLDAYTPCWTVPAPGISGFEYDVDLTGCESDGFSGGVHVNNSTFGPVILTFEATQILDWTFQGSLSFDYSAGGDRTWVTYNSDDKSTAGPPITVTGKGSPVSLTLAGGIHLPVGPGGEFDWWGAASDGSEQLGLGGPAESQAVTEDPGTHLTYHLMPAECRCQDGGDVVLPTSVAIATVTVDLDDLMDGDDGVDDPEVTFDVTDGPSGAVTLSAAETCGAFDVSFAPDGGSLTIALDSAALAAGFQAACDNGVVSDDGKCTRLSEAASSGSVAVTVPVAKVGSALTDWAHVTFDQGICSTGLETTGGGPH